MSEYNINKIKYSSNATYKEFMSIFGGIHREDNHRDFIGYLLDPTQTQGLGCSIIRTILSKANITNVDIETLNLNTLYVDVNIDNVDVFVLDRLNQMAIIIELKTESKEHNDQLGRYFRRMSKVFPDFRIIGFYLTKDGGLPNKIEDRQYYTTLTYDELCGNIETAIEDISDDIENENKWFITDYIKYTRLFINDNNNRCMARNTLFISKETFNRAVIKDTLKLPYKENDIYMNDSYLDDIYLKPNEWKRNRVWHLLSFIFNYGYKKDEGVLLRLIIPPKKDLRSKFRTEADSIETRIIELAKCHPLVFQIEHEKNNTSASHSIYQRRFIYPNEMGRDEQYLENAIQYGWTQFIKYDLPKIKEIIRDVPWMQNTL